MEERAQNMGSSILTNKKCKPIDAIRTAVKATDMGQPIQEWLDLKAFFLIG